MSTPERLYRLLPAIHRVRDAGEGEPLRALLGVIEEEFERIEADTAGLYDNWFIETCEEWVVPYIGDLLGVRPIQPIASAGVSARAYVANTIAYRRRKGTAVVLEQLARDTTGWPARAVEFFQRLSTTQHMNHVRPQAHATASLRDASTAELAGSAFERFSHSAEVRRAGTRGGRYNIPNVGMFLWRLNSYPLGFGAPEDAAPDFVSARDKGGWWSMHPAGLDTPLFNRPRTETTITHLAEEDNVPGPLRRLAIHAELERLRRGTALPAPVFMTPADPVLRIWARLAGENTPVEVRREDIYFCALPDEVLLASPVPRAVALDPARGRLAFAPTLAVDEVWTQHSYGFPGDLGGGPYDRNDAVFEANRGVAVDASAIGDTGGFFEPGVWQVGVSHLLDPASADAGVTLFATLREAVAVWNLQKAGRVGVIVLMDSLSDIDGPMSSDLSLEIEIGAASQLLIVAGAWPLEAGPLPGVLRRVPGHFDAQQVRAHFAGEIVVRGTAAASSTNAGACFINGLLLEGHISIAPGNLGQLSLAHCSLVAGPASLGAVLVAPYGNERLQLQLTHSICGLVSAAGPIAGITVADSIVGTDQGSPALSVDAPETALDLVRSSFFGGVLALSLSASDCIFAGGVQVLRRQTGCVRFSYVPPGSAAPRRYRCQPQLEVDTRVRQMQQSGVVTPAQAATVAAEVAAAVKPLFVSRDLGDAGYGQLELRCAVQIRTGAESGAEMGAFEFLRQPQREANLRGALDEYLRLGLEAGVFFTT